MLPLITLHLFSCVSQTVVSPPKTSRRPDRTIPGIYHKVGASETLWRISKTYGVELDELIKVNRIPDAAKIKKGQLIFIPKAKDQKMLLAVSTKTSKEERFIWPIKGKIISYFGQKFNERKNNGINIKINPKENIRAAKSGKASFCGEIKGYGKSIIIEHDDDLSTVYTNNSEILVNSKDYITQGMTIAKSGGGSSRTSYLHFEVRKKDRPYNPLHYLP